MKQRLPRPRRRCIRSLRTTSRTYPTCPIWSRQAAKPTHAGMPRPGLWCASSPPGAGTLWPPPTSGKPSTICVRSWKMPLTTISPSCSRFWPRPRSARRPPPTMPAPPPRVSRTPPLRPAGPPKVPTRPRKVRKTLRRPALPHTTICNLLRRSRSV